jgi:hypothetical protein
MLKQFIHIQANRRDHCESDILCVGAEEVIGDMRHKQRELCRDCSLILQYDNALAYCFISSATLIAGKGMSTKDNLSVLSSLG